MEGCSGSADGSDSTRGSGDISSNCSGVGSLTGSGVGSRIGSGVGSLMGSGVGSLTGSGVDSLTGSGVGSLTGSGVGSLMGSGAESGSGENSKSFSCIASIDLIWVDVASAVFSSTAASTASSGSSGLTLATATVAVATTVLATAAAAISFSDSATALGPRFTGVGVLLPTVFLGLEALGAAVLEAGVLEAVGLLSCGLGGLDVFVSVALLGVGFLEVTSDFEEDLGVSGFADFAVEAGRGDSADFLAAGVPGLVTSFFKGVVFLDVCDAEGLPPEGVVEVGLEAAGFVPMVEVFGVGGLDAAGELLAALVVEGLVEPEAGRVAPAGAVLVVLETGALSGLGEAVELGLVGVAEAGLEARGFFVAAAVVLVLTPLAVLDGIFLVVPVVDFAPSVAREAAAVFFSATFVVLFDAGAPVVPVGFLAVVGVVFLSEAGVVFLVTPLVWGLDTPFDGRAWDVLDREPGVVLVGAVPGFVLAAVLLVVLALESPEVLLLVLAAGVPLASCGWGSTGPVSSTGCCDISPSTELAAWLGSCPAASFGGLDSNVSIGSIAAVATPSGFISPSMVVRLCKAGLNRMATGREAF